MNHILYILLLTFGFAATINVPGDYDTIQDAIDAANDGDEIVIASGTYFENLWIEKGITLRSADPEDPAIIDGSQAAEGANGSCIIIRTPDEANQRISPTIEGLEITGGQGSEIIEDSNQNGVFDDEDETKIVGGGLLIINSSVTARNNTIRNNGISPNNNQGLSSTHGGGGGYVGASGIDLIDNNPDRPPRNFNTRAMISFSGTRFINNSSNSGRTIMSSGIDLIDNNPDRPDRTVDIDFSGAEFDVAFVDEDNPENSGVSEYWVIGDGESSFDFTGIEAETDAVIQDVWVNPDPTIGVDEGNLTGSINEPFLTIDYALSLVYSTEDSPVTIHLVSGTYSPSSNNETFPINLISNVLLSGAGQEYSIIDAQQTGRVIYMEECHNSSISGVTVRGGSLDSWWYGGAGIYMKNSSVNLNLMTLTENTSEYGAGMWIQASSPILTDVTISNNTAEAYDSDWDDYSGYAGGMYVKDTSHVILNNVTLRDNSAISSAAGIYSWYSTLVFNDCLLENNAAIEPGDWDDSYGGLIVSYYGDITINNCSVNDNESESFGIITNYYGPVSITGSDFNNNTKLLTAYGSDVSVNNSIFTNNHNGLSVFEITQEDGTSIPSSLSVQGSLFQDNYNCIDSGWGEECTGTAINIVNISSTLIENSIFDGNYQGLMASGENNIGLVSDCTFENHIGLVDDWDGSVSGGNGIYLITDSKIDIEGSFIENNDGNGIVLSNNATSDITSTIINGNGGNGAYIIASTVSFVDCSFDFNETGVLDISDGTIFTDCSFNNNIANGLTFSSNPSGNASDCTFNNNGGSGINAINSSPNIDNCIFLNNQNSGISRVGNGDLIINSSLFENNVGSNGGGIMINSSPNLDNINIENSTFRQNQATGVIDDWDGSITGGFGGAIYNYGDKDILIKNCLIEQNSAMIGGAFYSRSQADNEILLVNSTIVNNSASKGGAIMAEYGGIFKVINSILYFNQPEEINLGMSLENTGNIVEFYYSDIMGGFEEIEIYNTMWENNIIEMDESNIASNPNFISGLISECCDMAYAEFGLDCSTLESEFNWDCSGCDCIGDIQPECGDGNCDANGGETFETCSEDCGEQDCYDTSCGAFLWAYDSCEEMWQYDCSACAAQGQCPDIDNNADLDCNACVNDYSDVMTDYHLQEPSDCIDAGTADLSQFGLENISNSDYSGLAPDIGAFEMECTFYDECGVCDGPGAVYECGCNDPEIGYNCEGECIGETDCAGVCGGSTVEDCTGTCGGDCSECNECGDCLDNAVECYTVEVTTGSYPYEVSWELNPSDIQGGSPYLEECVSLDSGDYTLIMYDSWGDGWNGNEWSISDQDGNLIQSCTLSSGSEGECSFTLEGVEIPECTSLPGDINQDGALDVLDIVMMVGFILGNDAPDDTQSSIADMNGDGLLNVLDVVMMVDIVLGGGLARGDSADEVSFYYGNNFVSYKSDGNIAGIQFEVSGEYEITDNFLPDGWELEHNETTIILFSMDGSALDNKKLFSYTGDLSIESSIAADWHGSSVSTSSLVLPKEFDLSPAYPNPFNPVTTLEFSLPVEADVSIIVYNLQGREVVSLISGHMDFGYHSIVWNANAQASGVYFVRMIAGEHVHMQKLMLIK